MNKVKYVWICILLTIVMFCTNCGTTYSTTVQELKQEQNDVQSKLDEAEKELERVGNEMSAVEKQVTQLNSQISIYQEEVDTLKNKISDNEAKLKQAQADYEQRSSLLASRIISQYKTGDVTYLDFLLSSDGLVDFISNYYLVGEIVEMDITLLDQIEKTKVEIEQTKQQLEQDKASLEVQMNNLQSKKNEKETYKSQLSEEEKELEDLREEYNSTLEKIKNEIIQQSSTSSYIGGGQMAWPVPGYYINYNLDGNLFGYRWHPIYKDWRLHTGVDIQAPMGAKFVAAESGTVIIAGKYGGYGNTVVIDHGGGISTLYGHGTTILVSKGQYVTRETPVLTVGSTGNSTGPHAHFEVRKNGTAIDPLPYIT